MYVCKTDTCDSDITRSASTHCWEGDMPDTASYLKTLKKFPTAAMSDSRHKKLEIGEWLGPKQLQLITFAVRTSNSRVVQSKGCLSDGRMDALNHKHKTLVVCLSVWRGLEPEATPSP